MTQKSPALDWFERVAWTAAQAFLGTWLILQSHGQGFDKLVWQVCGASAAVNAVKCILLIGYHPHASNNPSLDALKRIMWTATSVFLGTWLTLELRGDGWDAALVLQVAGGAAVVTVAKVLVGLNIGNPNTAATLPAAVD